MSIMKTSEFYGFLNFDIYLVISHRKAAVSVGMLLKSSCLY